MLLFLKEKYTTPQWAGISAAIGWRSGSRSPLHCWLVFQRLLVEAAEVTPTTMACNHLFNSSFKQSDTSDFHRHLHPICTYLSPKHIGKINENRKSKWETQHMLGHWVLRTCSRGHFFPLRHRSLGSPDQTLLVPALGSGAWSRLLLPAPAPGSCSSD